MSDEKRVASEPYDGAFGFCPPIMSVGEAAAALHVCSTSIRRLCRKGQLRAFKLGRSWRVPRVALDELMAGEVLQGGDCVGD